jgi:hypothetical protein
MAFKLLDVQGMPCTKGAAAAHFALTGLPGEREVKRQRVKFLQGLLDHNAFAAPSWARGRCLEDGLMYRLDGQHSSAMLSELDERDIPLGLMIQMATWEFDTVSRDAVDLFNMFNNPRSARTNEDVMGVFRAGVPALSHLSRKFLVNVANGIHVRETEKWEDGDEDALGPYPPRDHGLYYGAEQSVAVALWLSRFQGTKNQSFLTQPAILAEMIHEWAVNEALATTFWTVVFTEFGEHDPSHPARVLAEFYRDATRKKYQRPPQWKAKAAKAWKTFLHTEVASAEAELASLTEPTAPDAAQKADPYAPTWTEPEPPISA